MDFIRKILKELSDYQSDTHLTLGDLIYHPYKMVYGDLKKIYRNDSLSHSISRAEKRGLIKKFINNKEEVYIAITELGEKELTKTKAEILKTPSEVGNWDGTYRLVIFDIPEDSRIIRDKLRRALKKFGFVGWQKSVWVTKENVTKSLRKFVRDNNLKDYILVVETKDLDNEKLESMVS